MLVYLVCEEMFSNHKQETVMYERFLEKLHTNPIDALLIANATGSHKKEIAAFSAAYEPVIPQIWQSEHALRLQGLPFHLYKTELVAPNGEMIYAIEDAICELQIEDASSYSYKYVCLDLFQSVDLPRTGVSKEAQGKSFVIPLNDLLKVLEQNLDDDTKEKLLQAKRNFYYKTKS